MNWPLLLIKELFDIAVPLEDVDHLEAVVAIAEKNHVAVDGEAAQIVTEFWPFPAKGAGEHGELTALLPNPVHKRAAHGTISALAREVFQNIL